MIYTKDNPSPEYAAAVKAGRKFHERKKTFTGLRCLRTYPTLKFLCGYFFADTLLDYGCGKGRQWEESNLVIPGGDTMGGGAAFRLPTTLQASLNLGGVYLYDPCVTKFSVLPVVKVYDGVWCCDVLEFIPPSDLPWVVREIGSLAYKFVLYNVSCRPGRKPGRDTAPTSPSYWLDLMEEATRARSSGVEVCLRLKEPDGTRRVHLLGRASGWQTFDVQQLTSLQCGLTPGAPG